MYRIFPECEGRCRFCGDEGHKRGEDEFQRPRLVWLQLREKKFDGAKKGCMVFPEGRQQIGQTSLVLTPGAVSDILEGAQDPNKIIEPGCPQIIGREASHKLLCIYMGIEFQLRVRT